MEGGFVKGDKNKTVFKWKNIHNAQNRARRLCNLTGDNDLKGAENDVKEPPQVHYEAAL